MKEEELKSLNYQLITSVLFIISIIISIFLTYDQKRETSGKKRIFTEEFDRNLNLFNRIYALIIILIILYININDYELSKIKGRNIKSSYHQIIGSLFSVISALIVLYVVIENFYENPNITSIENPII